MHADTRRSLLLFAGWFLIVNLYALAANNRLELGTDPAYDWIAGNPQVFHQTRSWSPLDQHHHWDSAWYLDIAQSGYSFAGPGQMSNLAFFPLYPMLIRALGWIGLPHALAGWLLSSAALCGALLVLARLIREHHPELEPQRAQVFLLCFPTAFFLNAVYTEALFLLLSLGCFLYLLRGDFRHAGLLGLAASLTRVTGLLLIVPMAVEYYRRQGLTWSWRQAPFILLPGLGLAGFFAFHGLAFGDVTAWFKVQASWGRGFALANFQFHNPAAVTNQVLDLLFLGFAAAACAAVWRRFGPTYALYMLATLAVALSSGTAVSINRYVLVLFPIFLLAAGMRSEAARSAWLFASVLLLGLNITLFVNGYWAG